MYTSLLSDMPPMQLLASGSLSWTIPKAWKKASLKEGKTSGRGGLPRLGHFHCIVQFPQKPSQENSNKANCGDVDCEALNFAVLNTCGKL
jgi:hypothetical protein